MLFFFDESYAYILAEATRTLSLQDDSEHEIDDSLWLGHTIIPRGFSVCEHTVRMDLSSTSDVEDPPQIHIINDLQDSTFCDRPFVKGGPLARFYAGVPITTPSGINIGAYCILDDSPRDGLSRKEIALMREMGRTIMTHLNMARANDEQRRGLKMVDALSSFVDSACRLRDERSSQPVRKPSRDQASPVPSASMMQANRTGSISTSTSSEIFDRATPPRMRVQNSRSDSATAQVPQPSVSHKSSASSADLAQPSGPSHSVSIEPGGRVKSTSFGSAPREHSPVDLQESVTSPRVPGPELFQAAAELVRVATEVDGTLFLDASGRTFKDLTQIPRPSRNGHLSSSATEDEDLTSKPPSVHVATEPCVVLGSSGRLPDTNPTEAFLKSLLRRYKHGKVWSFGEDLAGSSDDESPNQRASSSTLSTSEGVPSAPESRRKASRRKEVEEIQRLFPGVRNFAIRGIWDETIGRWFAACICFTYSPLRVLAPSEMNYVAAFCDVLMAEMKRLEVQASDKAKTDFISSISHELRSPLHGILGSVECLQDQHDEHHGSEELTQIETCGRTLLEIIDHLLDASMFNFNTPKAARAASRSGKPRDLSAGASGISPTATRSLETEVSLARLTEQIVDSGVYAWGCRQGREEMTSRDVTVTMHIDDFDKPKWNVRLLTGAYRRIVINLVSNALKYTSIGYVSIRLSAVELPGDSSRFNAVLEVSDSGVGMSHDFLKNSAFTAFSQEDHFVEGTGLGLNLVANILKQFGGKIDVKSEKNVGTRVAVTLPLAYAIDMPTKETPHIRSGAPPRESEIYEPSQNHTTKEIVVPVMIPILPSTTTQSTTQSSPSPVDLATGMAVHDAKRRLLVGFVHDETKLPPDVQDSKVKATSLLHANIRSMCSQMDLEIRAIDIVGLDVDLNIMTETQAIKSVQERSITSSLPASTKPLVIISRTEQSERLMKKRPSFAAMLTSGRVEYARSYWVAGLSDAIRRSLLIDVGRRTSVTSEAFSDPSLGTLDAILDKTDGRIPTRPESPGAFTNPLHTSSKQSGPEKESVISGELAQGNEEQSICLLLVDDNPINLHILATYAKKHGHPSVKATNGEEAFRAYRAAFPAPPTPGSVPQPSPKHKIILLDINMPVMDGYEASRQIRIYEREHNLTAATIVALTGLGSAAAQQEAYGSGMDLFLTKPVSLKQLKRLVDEIRNGTSS